MRLASCSARACRSSSPREPTTCAPAWLPARSPSSMRTACARARRCGPEAMGDSILVLNAGSSSIKSQLYACNEGDELARRFKGQIEGIGTRPHLSAADETGAPLVDSAWGPGELADVPSALDRVLTWIG